MGAAFGCGVFVVDSAIDISSSTVAEDVTTNFSSSATASEHLSPDIRRINSTNTTVAPITDDDLENISLPYSLTS